jgi:TRAP transporter TAXI family solute receptor
MGGHSMAENRKRDVNRIQALFMETFGLGPGVSLVASLLTVALVIFAIFWFFHSAPPHTITIASGPPGSSFETTAIRLRAILKKEGVTLKILPSKGSEENLMRLQLRKGGADIGYVQSGVTNTGDSSRIVSLGSVNFQPMMIFYRSATPLQLLSQLKGKRLVIGPPGSGDRSLAMTLLELNGISNSASATFVDLDSAAAAKALREGAVDAVFLMGDSASSDVMRNLLHSQDIHLFDVAQADGYSRRITYLNKLDLPKGSIDFGNDIPDHDVSLIGPTVELLARSDLHPALSDLVLEAAQQVHGRPGIFRHQGQFPAPLEQDFPISADALRFYKSGKSFFFRYLPFWMASLVNRILVVFVPLAVILVPGLRLIPAIFRWRIQMLIFRWYRSLLVLEREVQTRNTQTHSDKLLTRLDQIEIAVNKMKVPASFADQFYNLRGHIAFVRARILQAGEAR